MYHLVDVVHGNDQSFENVCTLLSFLQVELGTTYRDVVAVLYEVVYAVFEVEQFRAQLQWVARIGHQCNVVDGEGALQCCHLEEFVQDNVGVGIAFDVNNDAHSLSAGLVVDIRYAVEFTLLHQVGYVLYELLFVDTVWNLCHYNLVVLVVGLYLCLGTHNDAPTASLVGVLHTL